MRALHGLLGASLLLSGCLIADEDDIQGPRRPDATPVPLPDASPPLVDPPIDPPGPPFDDPNEVPFERDAVGRYDFAYLGFRDGPEIRFGNRRGEWSAVLPLEGGVTGAGSLAMSPTGHDLAFETFDHVDGGWSVHVLSLDTFEDRTVGHDARAALRPTWSPDGTRLLFFQWSQSGLELQMAESSGSAAPATVALAPAYGYEAFLRPDWSHDGREIFYSTLDRIVAHDVATGTDRDVVVSDDGEALGLPRLSPDGTTLAYVHGTALELVDRAGGTPRVLIALRGGASRLAWRPDGSSLAVVDDLDTGADTGNELRVVGLDGIPTHVDFLRGGIGAGDPEWSPDGSRLLYVAFAPRNGTNDCWLRVFHADAAVAVDLGLRGAGDAVTYPTWLHAIPGKRD